LLGLADARAQAVRTWLIEQGKVPAERVFLIATTLKGPRVQLNLR
jgi:outer membrane protein OmpA-like peptidoglycan-associated protein